MKTDRFHFIFTFHMKSISFHTRLCGPGTSHENTSCNIVFRSLLHEHYMKFSQIFRLAVRTRLADPCVAPCPRCWTAARPRAEAAAVVAWAYLGMCLRCARCSTVSLKTLPEKAPRRFHFRSKFQVKTFQVEIFARTLLWTDSSDDAQPSAATALSG